MIYPAEDNQLSHQHTTFLGRVNYLTDDELVRWQHQPISASDMYSLMIESFFLKRKPFEHEQEVRIIRTIPNDFCNVGVESLEFEIDPADLIDEFVIEPRLTNEQSDEVKGKLMDLGVSADKIRQSDLYKFKPMKIIVR